MTVLDSSGHCTSVQRWGKNSVTKGADGGNHLKCPHVGFPEAAMSVIFAPCEGSPRAVLLKKGRLKGFNDRLLHHWNLQQMMKADGFIVLKYRTNFMVRSLQLFSWKSLINRPFQWHYSCRSATHIFSSIQHLSFSPWRKLGYASREVCKYFGRVQIMPPIFFSPSKTPHCVHIDSRVTKCGQSHFCINVANQTDERLCIFLRIIFAIKISQFTTRMVLNNHVAIPSHSMGWILETWSRVRFHWINLRRSLFCESFEMSCCCSIKMICTFSII